MLRDNPQVSDLPDQPPQALDKFGMPIRLRSAIRQRSSPIAAGDSTQGAIFGIFVMLAISVTFLQKFGFGPNADTIVPLVVPITVLALIAGLAFGNLNFRPMRVTLYLLFILVSAITTLLFVTEYSPASLALYAVLYLPLVVSFPATEATYRRCMAFYSNLILVVVGIVIAQHVVQATVGWTYWPNLDKILPANVLIPNYNYIQPIVWNMPYMKPNAVFFLEVSYLSQYIALALIVEVVLLQRVWRMILFAGTLLATFAGTGPLLILLTAPVLVLGTSRVRTAVIVSLALVVVALLASELGWFDLISHRLDEFQHGGSSANMRFVEPLNRIVDALSTPAHVYSGIGPGLIEKAGIFQWWPLTKAIVEYGLIAGLLFYIFFTQAVFDAPPNVRMAVCLFVWFTIEGSLLTAINPATCMMFSTMFVIDRTARRNPAPVASRTATA